VCSVITLTSENSAVLAITSFHIYAICLSIISKNMYRHQRQGCKIGGLLENTVKKASKIAVACKVSLQKCMMERTERPNVM
jgi:hypothetical protein